LKKRTALPAALLLLWVKVAFTQSLRQPITATYTGLGAYSIRHQDVFSFVNNQAALAQLKLATAGVYGERRYQLTATSTYAAVAALPTSLGNVAINLKYAGFKNFSESQVGIAYARRLGPAVDIGVQFNYYGYRVPAYDNAQTLNIEIGALVHLTKQFTTGIHLFNPAGGRFSATGERLTTAIRMGFGYDASELFFVSAEVVKEEDYPVNVLAGIQYRFVQQFFLRAGIATATSAVYGGVGLRWGNFRLDINGSYHPQLGWSPGLLLIMELAAKKDDS